MSAESEWTKKLQAALTGATRMTAYGDGRGATIKSGSEIRDFLDHIQIGQTLPGETCFCDAEYTFEFYRGNELLATVSVHAGERLRWSGWEGEALLSENSQRFIVEWVAQFLR